MSIIRDSDRKAFEHYCETFSVSNFPRRYQKWYKEEAGQEERTTWLEMRFMCLKYPLFLGGYFQAHRPGDNELARPDDFKPIMGMDFQPQPHELLFKQFIQFRPGEDLVLGDLSHEFKKYMVLWSRGMFKTSSIIVLITQAILNYPNIRCCFLTGGDNLAKRQLDRVKRGFEKPTELFRWLFPEFCLKDVRNRKITDELAVNAWSAESPRMGTKHEFTVPCRTNTTFAEPTFAISTAKSVKSGSHYDIIFVDDLVNDQNYKNNEALAKCFQDYLDICPLLDPQGYIIVTGTRYSFGDTYEVIQGKAKEEEQQLGRTVWHFSIRDCWDSRCKHCQHRLSEHDRDINIAEPPCTAPVCACKGYETDGSKEVFFPEVRTRDGRAVGHTMDYLARERINLTPDFFACQYENNPLATESQTFPQTLLDQQTLHDPSQLPDYLVGNTFMVGDLAYVGQPGRDFSVIFVCRLFLGRIYLIDCEFGNWDSDAIARMTMTLVLRHRPTAIFYEKFNGWEAYQNVILAKAREYYLENLPLQWIKGAQTPNAKLTRIGAAKGPLAARRLWLYAPMKGYTQLCEQLLKWPKFGKNDDFADCLGMVVEAPTGYQLSAPPQDQSPTNWLRRMNNGPEDSDSYYDNGCGTGLCC